MIFYKEISNGILLDVYIQPRSSRNKIVGEYKNSLKIQLTKPPIKGAANKAFINFLAKEIGVSKSNIEIVRGENSRQKQIFIKGIDTDKLKYFLEKHKGD